MSKNPDFDEKDLVRESTDHDPLAQVYSGMVSPDIAEINEHAEELAKEAQIEPDSL